MHFADAKTIASDAGFRFYCRRDCWDSRATNGSDVWLAARCKEINPIRLRKRSIFLVIPYIQLLMRVIISDVFVEDDRIEQGTLLAIIHPINKY
jgi:hypothetical protein